MYQLRKVPSADLCQFLPAPVDHGAFAQFAQLPRGIALEAVGQGQQKRLPLVGIGNHVAEYLLVAVGDEFRPDGIVAYGAVQPQRWRLLRSESKQDLRCFILRQPAQGAELLGVPALFTEQYPKGLGPTVEALAPPRALVVEKTTFDATRAPGFLDRLASDHTLILTGCETHICVLQTALGLIAAGRRVAVVADAVGSRRAESKRLGLARMEKAGADIVTTEMVLFEWVGDARHPQFKAISALVK